jgi:hypothetical protein
MARELGLNPKKFGKLANNKQEPWKEPLSDFIETLYWRRFKKNCPDNVRSIERMVKEKKRKQTACKARRKERASQQQGSCDSEGTEDLPF